MSTMYNYQTQKQNLLTEKGIEMFVKMRDKAKELLKIAGCFRMDAVMGCVSGDSWDMLACIDKMVEMGELREITYHNQVAGQHRIFIAK